MNADPMRNLVAVPGAPVVKDLTAGPGDSSMHRAQESRRWLCQLTVCVGNSRY